MLEGYYEVILETPDGEFTIETTWSYYEALMYIADNREELEKDYKDLIDIKVYKYAFIGTVYSMKEEDEEND